MKTCRIWWVNRTTPSAELPKFHHVSVFLCTDGRRWLAARREDVTRVITVAGNLDHAAWTDHHRVTPLHNSLNPATLRASLASVEQIHLVGEQDRVIPPTLVNAFVADYPPNHRAKVKVLPGYGHKCCWVQNWPQLWQMVTQ